MGTPLKNTLKLLSPKVLSPISPKFLNVLKDGQRNGSPNVVKQIDFSDSNKNDFKHVKTPVKIKITRCENVLHEIKKNTVLINTPNKKLFLENGIGNQNTYEILGRGSFGKVFKATYKDSPVAMKLIKSTSNLSEKNALSLKHKNIVSTIEIVECKNNCFSLIIMEYLPNCTTLQNILSNYNVSFTQLLKYASQICEGLEYCHSNNILHLDLKPSNILIVNEISKICDFGNSVNSTENIINFKNRGTIHYTAPEMFLGENPTNKCDVYSTGIILWQIKTRISPYANIDNIECIIYKVVKCNLRPDSKNPNDWFSELYQKCWDKNCLVRPSVSEIFKKIILHLC